MVTFVPRRKTSEPLEQFADLRGLPTQLLIRHTVYVDDDLKPGWVAFTYRHLTGMWGTRYRRPDHLEDGPKYWQPPGTGVHLYNPLCLGPDADVVVVCEGEIDTLTALAAGLPAIGIPGTSNVPDEKGGGRFAKAWVTLFEDALRIVLALDNDAAGERAAGQLAVRWPQAKRLGFPAGVNDLNDWWRQDRDGLTVSLLEAAA